MKAHICIGGPLHGQFAISKDFYRGWKDDPGGMYKHLAAEYHQFNNAGRAFNRMGAHVCWIHVSLLKPSIKPSER